MLRVVLQFFRKQNWLLIAPALLLVVYGLVMSYSLGAAQQPADFNAFWRQVGFSTLGVVFLFLASAFDYRFTRTWSIGFFVASIVLLAGVKLFGSTIRGTQGWFVIFGITIQVVEVVKLLMIIGLGSYFAARKNKVISLRDILITGAGAGVLTVMVFFQPDIGSGLLLLAIYFGMLMLVQVRRSFLLLLVGILIAMSVFGWFFVLQDFHKERIRTLLDPERDPLGVGYNLTQSIIAVGSGQFFGRGLTLGPQSRLNFLPERQNDFIFAVIAEALGFFGVILLFVLLLSLFFQMFRVARRCRDDFGMLLAGGIALSLAIQTIINISTNVGLLPVAGLPLPFVSAGGSSLIISLISVGVVASVDTRQRVGMA